MYSVRKQLGDFIKQHRVRLMTKFITNNADLFALFSFLIFFNNL